MCRVRLFRLRESHGHDDGEDIDDENSDEAQEEDEGIVLNQASSDEDIGLYEDSSESASERFDGSAPPFCSHRSRLCSDQEAQSVRGRAKAELAQARRFALAALF